MPTYYPPVDPNAIPFTVIGKMSNDPIVRKITFALYERGNVLADMVFNTRKTQVWNFVRWEDNLPSVNFVPLNTPPIATYGTPTPRQESAHIARNVIEIDEVLEQDENVITDPVANQVKAWLKSFTYTCNNNFINNNHITGDSNANVGIRYRLDNPTSYGIPTQMKVDAGGVDISDSGLTAATANVFLKKVATVLQYMQAMSGSNVVMYVNDDMETRIDQVIRVLGIGAGFKTTTDNYDREVTTFRGAKIKNIGRLADQVTNIITSTEDQYGNNGSGNYTSIYFVNHAEDAFCGWHYEPLKPKPVFTDDTGVIRRTVLQYVFGYRCEDNRCLARLYDIKTS